MLQLRKDISQRHGREPEDPQPPPRAAVDIQPDRERLRLLAQPLHHREVRHGRGRHGVGLVGLRDAVGAGPQHLRGAGRAELALGFRGQVVVPGADRRGDARLQGRLVGLSQHAARGGVHDDVQPGQGAVAHHRAVVDLAAAEGGFQYVLDTQPYLGRVAVPWQVDEARDVAPVNVWPYEEAYLLALGKAEDGHGDRGELLRADLEELLTGVTLEDLDERLAVVAVDGHPGGLEHPVDLAPQHRDAGDRLGVGGLRVQAEEAVLADDLAGVLPEPPDGDVVEVGRPVDRGHRGGLGEHEKPRLVRAVLALPFGSWRGDREGVVPVVPEDAQAGAGHGLELFVDEVVGPVAKEGEVAGRQPGEQLAGLGFLRTARVGEHLDEVAGGGPHAALVLHRDPQVVEDPPQVAGQVVVVDVTEFDVDPGLSDGVRVLVRGVRAVGVSCHVPVDGEQRVHDEQDVGAVPVELHRHRVDQVRHVVGDDVDDGARLSERGFVPACDADRRAALRAACAQGGVLCGGRGQPGGAGGHQVFDGDAPVVRGEEAKRVTDRLAGDAPRRGRISVRGGPLTRRLGDQFLSGVV